MSFRIRPDSIINFYDKSFIENLKADTPSVRCPEMRQFFRYASETYQNYIHTPTENLLTWQPMAVTICLIALVATIAVWIIR